MPFPVSSSSQLLPLLRSTGDASRHSRSPSSSRYASTLQSSRPQMTASRVTSGTVLRWNCGLLISPARIHKGGENTLSMRRVLSRVRPMSRRSATAYTGMPPATIAREPFGWNESNTSATATQAILSV